MPTQGIIRRYTLIVEKVSDTYIRSETNSYEAKKKKPTFLGEGSDSVAPEIFERLNDQI